MTPDAYSSDRPSPRADDFSAGIRLEAQFADEHARHYTAEQWTARADFLNGEIDEIHAEMARLRARVAELCGRRLVASIRARVIGQEEKS